MAFSRMRDLRAICLRVLRSCSKACSTSRSLAVIASNCCRSASFSRHSRCSMSSRWRVPHVTAEALSVSAAPDGARSIQSGDSKRDAAERPHHSPASFRKPRSAGKRASGRNRAASSGQIALNHAGTASSGAKEPSSSRSKPMMFMASNNSPMRGSFTGRSMSGQNLSGLPCAALFNSMACHQRLFNELRSCDSHYAHARGCQMILEIFWIFSGDRAVS